MKVLPLTPELERVAGRCVWYLPAREAIADTNHFISHVLTYGTHDDVKAVREYLSDDDLSEVLDHAPPGVFDPRSWAYWNLMVGRYETPPMPARKLP